MGIHLCFYRKIDEKEETTPFGYNGFENCDEFFESETGESSLRFENDSRFAHFNDMDREVVTIGNPYDCNVGWRPSNFKKEREAVSSFKNKERFEKILSFLEKHKNIYIMVSY